MKTLKLCVRTALLFACILVLPACSEPEVEQKRYSHVNSTGQTQPISYEVASDWLVGNGGRYSLPDVRANMATLSFDVSAARHMKEPLADKLKRLTSRGQTDRDRKVLTSKMTTVNGFEALVYGEQGEAYKPPEDRYFTHQVEFVAGPYLIETKIRGHASNYPVLLEQLEHTLSSIRIEES